MAESKNNIITHGLSGKVGDMLVFSQRGGKTIVSKAPRKKSAEDTDKQKAHKIKFQQAVIYAKSVLQNPTQKALYEASASKDKNISAYNITVADMLNAPNIDKIDVSNYTGQIGDTISVRVTDDFLVVSVKVMIHNADGTLVEEGNATKINGIDWVYTAIAVNADLSGDKITIQAFDTPNNISEEVQTL